jgi:cation diffusion facilitator CzcD-associated flavoprotein CzcO
MDTDVAIVGAGPYGLSLAAHLEGAGIQHRIFGRPMYSWREHMPQGMCLKSDGFASNLYDPKGSFSLERFCEERGLAYQRSGLPIPLEVFVDYGVEFQRRMVPHLEQTDIAQIAACPGGFRLTTAEGATLTARRVVLAVGITHFAYTPPMLSALPAEVSTHSSAYGDVSRFAGQTVVVVGAGASAVDFASALADVGALVHLVGRRKSLAFYTPDLEPRPFVDQVKKPRSGLGLGWKLRFLADAPLTFYKLPRKLRHRIVRRHLGPVPAWFMRDKIESRIPLHMSAAITRVEVVEGIDQKVRICFTQPDKGSQEIVADHVIAATGYRPSVRSLKFVDEQILGRIETAEDTPLLSRAFETSVRGLHMVGLASSNHFGPICRFACGAKFTSRHLSRFLGRELARG